MATTHVTTPLRVASKPTQTPQKYGATSKMAGKVSANAMTDLPAKSLVRTW